MVLQGRSRKVALLLGVLCAFGPAVPVSTASDEIPFTGYVRDTLGTGLRGVEIFFLREQPGRPPAASVSSLDDGSYLVPDLLPGMYRIAASKEGYRLYLGRVNTLVRNSLNLILQPLGTGDGPRILPADATWVLRVPRRSVLHETDPVELLRASSGGGEEPESRAAIHEVFRGRLSHTFALGGSDLGLDRGELQGMETRMRLAGFLGERGKIRLDGARENLEGTLPGRDVSRMGNHLRSSVGLGFDYQATRDADLRFDAFYLRNDFRPLRVATVPRDPLREEQRSWGYDAVWSQQLDPISRLDVRMDFRDISLEAQDTPVSQRTMGAGGVYESLPARGHQLTVAFRADYLHLQEPGIRSSLSAAGLPVSGDAGWNVGIQAEDSWSVSGPVTLVYGLGYRHVISDRDWILVAPRLGGMMQAGAVSARAMLSYHAVDAWGTGFRPPQLPYLEKLGYETEVETVLPRGFRIRGSASHTPVRPGGDGGLDPDFVSDGNAAVRQVSVSFLHEQGGATAYVQWSGGRAAGMLASVRPYDAPYLLLAPRSLEYSCGRLGYHLPPAGLDLVLEYRRQEQARLELPALPGEGLQEQVELRLLQDLLRPRGGSAWQLLLAVRRSSFRPYEAEGPADATVASAAPVTHHRVNAGLAVAF